MSFGARVGKMPPKCVLKYAVEQNETETKPLEKGKPPFITKRAWKGVRTRCEIVCHPEMVLRGRCRVAPTSDLCPGHRRAVAIIYSSVTIQRCVWLMILSASAGLEMAAMKGVELGFSFAMKIAAGLLRE